MEWMIMPYKRYADFSGRSRRKEYWMFTLFLVIAYIVLAVIGGALSSGSGESSSLALLVIGIFVLGSLIPSLAVQVRRFHDQGKSGWFILLGLIPVVGELIVLVFMCLEGTAGPNEYGPDPKDASGNPDVFS